MKKSIITIVFILCVVNRSKYGSISGAESSEKLLRTSEFESEAEQDHCSLQCRRVGALLTCALISFGTFLVNQQGQTVMKPCADVVALNGQGSTVQEYRLMLVDQASQSDHALELIDHDGNVVNRIVDVRGDGTEYLFMQRRSSVDGGDEADEWILDDTVMMKRVPEYPTYECWYDGYDWIHGVMFMNYERDRFELNIGSKFYIAQEHLDSTTHWSNTLTFPGTYGDREPLGTLERNVPLEEEDSLLFRLCVPNRQHHPERTAEKAKTLAGAAIVYDKVANQELTPHQDDEGQFLRKRTLDE